MDNRKKVLIGDDSSDFGMIYQNKLKEKGYDVILTKRDGCYSDEKRWRADPQCN